MQAGARWAARLPLWLAWLAVLAAGAWCIWVLVQLLWALLTPLAPQPTALQPSQSPTSSRAASHPDLASLHLFGNGRANEIKTRIVKASRATQLNLTLHGTVTFGDDGRGFALIADAGGHSDSYRVGEQIQRGVTLDAVYADHVVLDHDGVNERLDLPRESLAGAASIQPLSGTASGAARRPGAVASRAPDATPSRAIFVPPRATTGRVNWQDLKAQVERNPVQAMAKLQLMPVFEGTQLQGVRIGGGGGNPLLAGTGLEANDVVTSVNGIALDSIARGQQLFDQLKGASHVQIKVLRNGQSKTLDIDLSQVR